MKESIFNIHFNLNNEKYIYNSYNSGIIKIGDIKGLSNHEKEYLYNNHFFIDNDFDEIALLEKEVNNNISKNSRTLSLTIQLTKQCNFSCVYCYQNKKLNIMSADTADMVLSEIKKICKINSIENLRIQYFGGEPLLNPEILLYFDKKLKQLAKLYHLKYSSFITTNGSLLNKYLLKKIQFERIQITLDGLDKNHDYFRMSDYFKFSNEMELAKDIIKNSTSLILFRMNVCKENMDDVIPLCNYLFNNFPSERIEFFLNRMIKFHDKDPFTMIDDDKYMELCDAVEEIRFENNKKVSLPIRRSYPCGFTCNKSFMISSNGKVLPCSGSPIEDGELFNNYIPEKYIYKVSAECKTCKVLPLCLGKCPVMTNQHCNSCIKEKKYIVNRIKRYLEGMSHE